MYKRFLYIGILIVILALLGLSFVFSSSAADPYARRIRPFNAVPVSCMENETGYSMTLHKLYICTNTGYKEIDIGGAITFAPIGSKYVVQTPDASLTNEQALSVLSTGILKNTTTTGVLSIAGVGDVNSILPTQTSNSGKYLTTNGTVSSWASVATGITNSAAVNILGKSDGTNIVGSRLTDNGTNILIDSKINAFTAGNVSIGDITGAANSTTIVINDAAGTITLTGITNASAINATTIVGTRFNGNILTTGTYTLTGAAAKTLSFNNTLTFAGTDNSTLNIGTGGTLGTNAFLSTTFAPLNAPTFTGIVTIPTGAQITNPNIIGTATNDNAAAGSVGEIISSPVVVGSAVSLSTGVQTNLTSIPLTAGDWDVSVNGIFVPGASTTVTNLYISISTTSATIDFTGGRFGGVSYPSGSVLGAVYNPTWSGPARISVSGNTTVYAVAQANFGVSTMTVWGLLRARRVR